MFLNLGFPMGAIMFLTISLIMYIIKKKYHDFQNKIYVFLFSLTFALLFLEIAYVLTMSNIDKIPHLNEFVCRLFLIGIIAWMVFFFFYILSIGMNNLSNEKKEKYTKIIPYLILVIITTFSLIDCFFKIEYITEVGLYAIVGPATYFVYGMVGFLMVILLIIIIKNKHRYSNTLRIPMFFTLLLIVVDTIHLFVFEINDLTLILSLIVSSLYFTVESQDRMLLKEVEEARLTSEKLNQAKTEFLSNMSHEIRTPMNTILGFSNALLMEEHLTREQVLEDAKSINKASISLLDLINNILDISRIESEKETINDREYKLADILTEINNILKSKSGEKNNYYDLEVNKEMPGTYYGDYSKILKIISAIVLNALKYSSNGYINVSVNNEIIDNNSYLEFVISNTNSSIPDSYYNSDFSDFSKLGDGKDNRLDSELLGVVIAKRYVDLLENSSLEFKKEGDNTTKCIVRLLQKAVGTDVVGSNYLQVGETKTVDCSNKKALVVDDNEINLKLAERLLKSYNFSVTKVNSGSECINLVKANDYDVIFLDHMMPELDGISTLKIIKNLNKKVPVIIAMTANSNSDSKDFYQSQGFDDYLGKPINQKRLDALIVEFFGGKL